MRRRCRPTSREYRSRFAIRHGRPAEQRADLAKALVEACVEILGLRLDQLNVELTQHSGDEMYHPMLGGLSADWQPGEA